MNSLFRTFKTDPQMEKSGVWVDYGPNSKGNPQRVLLARAGGANLDFSKALEVATRPYRKALQAGVLDKQIQEELYKKVFVETVVKGWVNFEDEDDQDLEFTSENVTSLLDKLPELYADWQEQANRIAIFREELMERDLGNSGRS